MRCFASMLATVLATVALFSLLGCSEEEAEPPTRATRSPEQTDTPSEARFRPVAGGVTWRAEEPFVVDRPDNELRSFEYTVRDHPGALLTVSHFPPAEGGGGDVRANVDRWVGQFQNASEPRIAERAINDLSVTTVDVRGTFVGRLGTAHFGGGGAAGPRPGWRLLGAIVEGEQGLVFFKLLGPEAGVTIAADVFEDLVESIQPA